MRFDTVIIGGGLAGLTAGIRLQKAGRKTVIVSGGQNALHFFSGAFEMNEADNSEAVRFFSEAGVRLHGKPGMLRLTPMGTFVPSWAALGDTTLYETPNIGRKALIVNFEGYHDFFPQFLAEGLEDNGTSCRIASIRIPEMERLRESPSEMRSTNIARVMDRCWEKVVRQVRLSRKYEDVVIMPQVFGLRDESVPDNIRKAVPEVTFVGTLPPSVPGIRTQIQLKKAYENLGGTFLMGDTVNGAAVHEGVVNSVTTVNLDSTRLSADNFILASGSYFSKGLVSTPSTVYEPLFGLDTDFGEVRSSWYDPDFFASQKYMDFGVRTDADLRPLKDGEPLTNLFVAGSILGNAHPLGKGASLAILSAFKVSDKILSI